MECSGVQCNLCSVVQYSVVVGVVVAVVVYVVQCSVVYCSVVQSSVVQPSVVQRLLLKLLQNLHIFLIFDKVHNPLHLPHKTASERPKVVRTFGVFRILTWTCASRHNGVRLFDTSTSKSGRGCQFLTLLTWKCASCHNGVRFFLMSTSKSGPRMVCFVHVLRATTACALSTPQFPRVV